MLSQTVASVKACGNLGLSLLPTLCCSSSLRAVGSLTARQEQTTTSKIKTGLQPISHLLIKMKRRLGVAFKETNRTQAFAGCHFPATARVGVGTRRGLVIATSDMDLSRPIGVIALRGYGDCATIIKHNSIVCRTITEDVPRRVGSQPSPNSVEDVRPSASTRRLPLHERTLPGQTVGQCHCLSRASGWKGGIVSELSFRYWQRICLNFHLWGGGTCPCARAAW